MKPVKLTQQQLRRLINESIGASFAQSVPGIAASCSDIAMTATDEIEDVYSGQLDAGAIQAIEVDIRLGLMSAVDKLVQEIYANIDSGKYDA